MSTLTPSSDLVSQAGRAAHDLGLAAIVGGNLFGRMALHPAVERISDPAERGEVVNAAWRRYGTVNSLGLAALTAGWAGARAEEVRGRGRLTARERTLARAKDALVGTVLVTGLATAAEGMRFARQAPGGAVPLADSSHPLPSTPAPAARLKRRLNVLGAVAIGAEAALVAVNAALSQEGLRRSPLRRSVRRWG
ncbi:MAG: hypothetical protein HZB46_14565 [Solirubrobacterales bacterium]|nr:hypothetical protein [Solirubrobacterales bacterium]